MTLETDRSLPRTSIPVAAASARLSVSHAVERLWARDHRLWKQDPTDIANRLGWLTIIQYMKIGPRSCGPSPLRPKARHPRRGPARDGWQQLGTGSAARVIWVIPRVPRLGSSIPPFQAGFDRSRSRSTRLEACSSSPANPAEPSKSCPSLPTFGNAFTKPRATKAANSSCHYRSRHRVRRNWRQSISSGASLRTHRHRWTVLSPLLFWISPCRPDGDRCRTIAHTCHSHGPGLSNPAPSWTEPRCRPWRNDGLTGASRTQQDHPDRITANHHIWSVGEQLLAESTGKEGTGLIPVANELIVSPTAYGTDRLFVYLRLKEIRIDSSNDRSPDSRDRAIQS
jgi:glucose-6-phosphate isomerase/transaldolase/glucose-6-phosphate isomerase